MRPSTLIIASVEWILITVISACAVISLTPSNFYLWLHNLLARNHQTLADYLPLIIWFIIFETGIMTVFVWKRGGGVVFYIALLAALPSIAAFNSLDLLNVFGIHSSITTGLSFWQVLLYGAVIVICYVLLNSMNVLKLARLGMINRKASPEDIEQVNELGHLFALLTTITALAAVAVICGLSWGLETLISARLPQVPWYVVPLGLGCILVLGVYIYWIGIGKQSERNNDEGELR